MSDWQSWIGRTTVAEAELDVGTANRMAVTLDRAPVFVTGDALPPAWHWLYFHEVVPASRLGADGHPALGETMPPVPLPRRMWAGGSLSFDAPLHLGERATRTSTIGDIVPKRGGTGELYFVTVQHSIAVDGRPAVTEEQTIVYREMPTGPTPVDGPSAPADADVTETWQLDTTALFRYSALTFNGHRIHYDADYARSVEGYPGVVIHGPLLATLLLDVGTRHVGALRSFTYRARSPLFAPGAFTVNARRSGDDDPDHVTLWAATTDGRLAMSADAITRR